MRELSLFTGAGGGIYGSILLGWRTVGYVEIDEYCCKVIEQRIRDKIFDEAPIWQMDVREFNTRVAQSYAGLVDVVTAGFPCQPFSVAGKQLSEDDPRNMWPATIQAIRIIRPPWCLLENVPALMRGRPGRAAYLGRIYGDLAEIGYDAQWDCIPASAIGANHPRDRLWIVAHTDGSREQQSQGSITNQRRWIGDSYPKISRPLAGNSAWHEVEPRLDRLVHGVANWWERITAGGQGQVPAVVRAAWRLLGEP